MFSGVTNWLSRKFLYPLIFTALSTLNNSIHFLSDAQLEKIALLILAFIGGESIADAVSRFKNS